MKAKNKHLLDYIWSYYHKSCVKRQEGDFMKIFMMLIIIFMFLMDTFFFAIRKININKPFNFSSFNISGEVYKGNQRYYTGLTNLKYVFMSLIYIGLFVLLPLGLLNKLYNYFFQTIRDSLLTDLVVFWILGFVFLILITAKNATETFVINQKAGINRMTKKLFVLDWVKKTLFGVLFCSFFVFVFSYYLLNDGLNAKIVVFMAIYIFFLIIIYEITTHKSRPLENGPLKEKIVKYTEESGVKIDNILVIEESKRTTLMNAFCVSNIKRTKVFIFDNLINNLNENEILATYAHEIGHIKTKGMFKYRFVSLFIIFFSFVSFILLVTLTNFYTYFSFAEPNIILIVLSFFPIYKIIDTISAPIKNALSRKIERQADLYAANTTDKKDLINALTHVYQANRMILKFSKADVIMYYNHPPFEERIEYIKNL